MQALVFSLLSHLLHDDVPGCQGNWIISSHSNKDLLYCWAAVNSCIHRLLQLDDLTPSDALVHRDDSAGLG